MKVDWHNARGIAVIAFILAMVGFGGMYLRPKLMGTGYQWQLNTSISYTEFIIVFVVVFGSLWFINRYFLAHKK
ncbi:MAG: hypothetical protein QG604_810 [Candidatus Dependentiae bacterium]|nr:hypothetical protein [Candidatus Dependentiae bacterium]